VKLLSEYIDEGLEIIAEEKGGKKEWYIQGPMICAEKVNANGRIYKADTIATEVDRYIREVVKQNKAVGNSIMPPARTSITNEQVISSPNYIVSVIHGWAALNSSTHPWEGSPSP